MNVAQAARNAVVEHAQLPDAPELPPEPEPLPEPEPEEPADDDDEPPPVDPVLALWLGVADDDGRTAADFFGVAAGDDGMVAVGAD